MIHINNIHQIKNEDNIIYDKILEVHLDKEDLEMIPDKIFEFTNLHVLNLSNNLIKTIPNKIGNLINLQELYLDNNMISDIPEEIGNLKTTRKKFELKYIKKKI